MVTRVNINNNNNNNDKWGDSLTDVTEWHAMFEQILFVTVDVENNTKKCNIFSLIVDSLRRP